MDGLLGRKDGKIRLLIIAAGLILVYLLSVTVVPDLKIWTKRIAYGNPSDTTAKTLEEGAVYESLFQMPFDKCSGFSVDLSGADSNRVIFLDVLCELTDSQGNVAGRGNITSCYDNEVTFPYADVVRSETYTLRITVNRVGTDPQKDDVLPQILLDKATGSPTFTLSGRNDGAPHKGIFAALYGLCALMVLGAWYFKDRIRDRKALSYEIILWSVVVFEALFLISQYSDLASITKSAVKMTDAFSHGRILSYMDYAYEDELLNGDALLRSGTPQMMFVSDYNFVSVFIVSVLLLPFYKTLGPFMTEGALLKTLVLILSVFMIALVFLAAKLIADAARTSVDDDGYVDEVRTFFLFNPIVLFVTAVFGQIDIISICLMAAAVSFYLKGKCKTFSLIMSFAAAVKILPVMICIPLILLANKKVRDILLNLLLVISVPALTSLLFGTSRGYQAIHSMNADLYSYKDRLTSASVGNGLSLFILFFIIICAICFYVKVDDNDRPKKLYMTMWVIFAQWSVFSVFVMWHPQWLIPLAMSAAFLIPFMRKEYGIHIYNAALQVLFMVISFYHGLQLSSMLGNGLFGGDAGYYYEGLEVNEMIPDISFAYKCLLTAFAAILILMTAFFYKNMRQGVVYSKDTGAAVSCGRVYAVVQILLLYVFLLFLFWCYFYIG